MDKTLTLSDALRQASGAKRLALGGWSFSRRPCAMVKALLDAGLRFEELVVLTGGLETDLLLAAGAVDRVRAFYLGMEALGNGPGLRRGTEIVEESEGSLMLGLTAAAQKQSFLPLPVEHGHALMDLRSDLKMVECPYSGRAYVAVPALVPDLAILHVRRADRMGNVILGGNKGADKLLATAARTTLVSCDELVDDITGDGIEADIAGPLIAGVVHLPRGAAPTACQPLYDANWDALITYTGLALEDTPAWLAREVTGEVV